MKLTLVPISLEEANAVVLRLHRHHGAVVGHKFSLAAAVDDTIVGVAIIGRPVARHLDDGWTLEVLRVATDGTQNTCSFLYGAAWRACRALGYRRLGTYVLADESGVSLRAAGWEIVGAVPGRSWDCPSRPRVDRCPLQGKLRWAPRESA